MTRPADRLRPALPLCAAALLAAGCVTSSQVEERAKALDHLLEAERDPMYACAPEALARAEAGLASARHESSRGRPVSAKERLLEAEAASRDAWKGSRDRLCLPDADGDGVPDRVDRCLSLAEDPDGWQDDDGCPDPDDDGDGVQDRADQCPREPGLPGNRGCPVRDKDGDGLDDPDDICPDEAGPRVNRGCPYADQDKDGVEDASDKCPDRPGDPANGGCPYERIQITESRIELKEMVFFQTGKAVIKKESHPLLDEVAQALRDHERIRVRIEGHTDSQGSDRANLKLSQARAESVRAFLVARGVEGDRMVALGRGEEVPLDDNATEAGRAVNRRVEFHILSQ